MVKGSIPSQGHIPGLPVRSQPARMNAGGNRHLCFFLAVPLLPFYSLKINGENITG